MRYRIARNSAAFSRYCTAPLILRIVTSIWRVHPCYPEFCGKTSLVFGLVGCAFVIVLVGWFVLICLLRITFPYLIVLCSVSFYLWCHLSDGVKFSHGFLFFFLSYFGDDFNVWLKHMILDIVNDNLVKLPKPCDKSSRVFAINRSLFYKGQKIRTKTPVKCGVMWW